MLKPLSGYTSSNEKVPSPCFFLLLSTLKPFLSINQSCSTYLSSVLQCDEGSVFSRRGLYHQFQCADTMIQPRTLTVQSPTVEGAKWVLFDTVTPSFPDPPIEPSLTYSAI
jgi:hypothetical protein